MTQTSSDDPPLPDDESPELSIDKIFHILQAQRRRDALRYLKEHDEPVEMRDLAEQVAAWENDTTVQALASDERQRVYIALYQSHLPKLDNEDVIEYNKSRGIVKRGAFAAQFDPYLDMPENAGTDADSDGTGKDDDRWFRYYRWATAASVGTLAAAWLSLPPMTVVANHVVGAAIIALYAFISVAQIALR